ncbi:Fic family protein [Mangrovimonas sp. CR14]|uniref:Fic family protein n=1 Tax=Mangrovimonas sp. CR14 TaxID=2706120 RepID=UPI00141FD71D|nr:Fic family protein [Mangrovimonas sp. CR14]NIK91163.1 Fic family protein [Mangrovimonas sp. CR14]
MRYKIPNISADLDLTENLKNIDKIIDNLNRRRDHGLDADLENRLKKHLLISSVYNSNAIEGNKLSLRETEIILDGMVINERPLKDEIEAKSLANATEYLYKLIDGREQLSKRTLEELHSLIMENIPKIIGGQFRKEEVSIKNSEHIPISWLDIELEIDELFKWMNRNMHKYNPIVMSAILHHWLVWIHPFSDGNGRVTRLFTNFFLLQKGFPEIVVKIGDRDNYYNALIDADKGDITKLVDLFSDKIRQTVNIYEEFLNEHDRQIAWKKRYKELGEEKYSDAKETFSYQYEVWQNQLNTFKTILAKNVETIDKLLPNISFYIKEYEILSYSQYLDILEDRKVSNTWYFVLSVRNNDNNDSMGFVFYFERFRPTGKANIVEGKVKKRPHIKLYVAARRDQESFKLNRNVDLVNVGTHRDQLSFGVHNRNWNPKLQDKNSRASIITVKDNPNKIVRTFIDQILFNYFDVGKKKPRRINR